MKGSGVIDSTTEFGQRVQQRLTDEPVCWFTTVTPAGQPMAIPIWFLWQEDETVLIYSQDNTVKLRNIRANPKVSVNLNSNEWGGDIIRLEGKAEIPANYPAANDVPAFIEKYHQRMASIPDTPEGYAAMFSVPILVRPEKLRGF
jgi:PPOX class probable F420-dependent enzyme